MKNRGLDIIIGIVIGLAMVAIGTWIHLIYLSRRDGLAIDQILSFANQHGNFGAIVAMGAIANLIAFFVLLRFNKEVMAKGVLIATFGIAIWLLIDKLF